MFRAKKCVALEFFSVAEWTLKHVSAILIQVTSMKQHCRILLRTSFVVLILGIATTSLHADLPQQRKAIDELQAAKTSSDPLPLLESAKARLGKANKGNKAGDRDDAVDKVQEAIDELKAGDKKKMEQKINAAIANIHQGKDKSKK